MSIDELYPVGVNGRTDHRETTARLHARVQDEIHVSDYGGNVQNAIDALGTPGGRVVFGPGTYTIPALTLRTRLTLQGAGKNSTILRYTGSGAALAYSGVPAEYFDLRDLTLSGSERGVGLDLNQLSDACLSRVLIADFATGIHIRGSALHTILESVYLYGNTIGLHVDAYKSNEARVVNCRIKNNATGVRITHSAHTILRDCSLESNGVGVDVTATVANVTKGTLIADCRFEANTEIAVRDDANCQTTRVFRPFYGGMTEQVMVLTGQGSEVVA